MIKHKHSQAGFGIVEALCFIAMFSMVGLIGWYVINENQKSQETLDNIGGAEIQTSSSKPAAAGDKLVFKELGVSIKLSEDLSDLSYSTSTEHKYIYLTTTQFRSKARACGHTGNASFAALGKGSGPYPAQPTPNDGNLLKQFDEFYIGLVVPDGKWCEDSKKDAEIRTASGELQSAIAEAFKDAALIE